MKKKVLALMILFITFSGICFAENYKKGTKVYVSTNEVALKDSDGKFAKDVKKLKYGDMVIVVQTKGKKTMVTYGKISGWIPTGSITKKKIAKTASGSNVRASGEELSLAGKGFSQEAEKAFRSMNKELKYDVVDSMEKIQVSESELQKFIESGNLTQE